MLALPTPALGMPAAPSDGAGAVANAPGAPDDDPVLPTFDVPICVCVTYQGHGNAGNPRWQNPVTLWVYSTGTNQILAQTTQTTDIWGKNVCVVARGVNSSTVVNIRVKNFHTLSNMHTGLALLNSTPKTYNMGMLLEGDADDNDEVGIVDYSILRTNYGLAVPPGDVRADFNVDKMIEILDFSLLRTNYAMVGPIPVSLSPVYPGVAGAPILMRPAAAGVTAKLVPASVVVPAGAAVPIDIMLEAGAQPVDGSAIYLDFNPEALQIVDANGVPVDAITPGETLPDILQNAVDNTLGHINFSAGVLSGDVPSGKITVGRFYVSQRMSPYGGFTAISFSNEIPRRTMVAYAGEPVLATTENGQVKAPNLKLWLPAIVNDAVAAPVIR